MRLEDIGFYTLSDYRATHVRSDSPLHRCELVLTDRCNFNCPYCQSSHVGTDLDLEDAMRILEIWLDNGLKNIRFSGGEPTLYPYLLELIAFVKGIDHIAISTNGSAKRSFYEKMIDAGVNDFSISLDACCASFGEKMNGGVRGAWVRVVQNIKYLAGRTYVTVGMVFSKENITDLSSTIEFASLLGVADIRIISAAQYNEPLPRLNEIPMTILSKHPILNYRVSNYLSGRNVRGIGLEDSYKCKLVFDDMAVKGKYHYPCIIYLREGGSPIGEMSHKVRQERASWYRRHNSHTDPICRKNCLDVCVDYNNKAASI